MISKRKRALSLALIMVAATVPLLAKTEVSLGGGDQNTLNLTFVTNAVNLIVGVFAGGYVLLKAALDIFHAVRNSSEDQNALKRAIGSLVLNIAILGGFMFTVNYILAGMVPEGDIGDMNAQQAFFAALSGAIASNIP